MAEGYAQASAQWATYAGKAFAQHMCINLGGFHTLVSQQFLYGTDIRALTQQLGGEAVAQCVTEPARGNDAALIACLTAFCTADGWI